MARLAAVFSFATLLAACGGKFEVAPDDGGSSDTGATRDTGGYGDAIDLDGGSVDAGGACTEGACGPRPGTPSERCWDGSYAVAVCERLAAGGCGWVSEKCPPRKPCTAASGCGSTKLFCEIPEGVCGGSGLCALVPTVCGKNYDPVCGCNHVTYGNPCLAQQAGSSVNYHAPCETPPPPPPSTACGGFAGGVCSSKEFCSYTGGGCGFADGGGSCKPRPFACPDLYAPVCGCDSKTYGNECDANAAGLDIQYKGVCK